MRLGYNYRLSDINCALGIVQLSRIDEFKAKRKQVAGWYQEMLESDERLIVSSGNINNIRGVTINSSPYYCYYCVRKINSNYIVYNRTDTNCYC